MVTDSIPMLIITNLEMESTFESYAAHKKHEGTNTVVIPIESILISYPRDSVYESVRECIKDYYYNYNTKWVLLGGDVDIIPGVYVLTTGYEYLTDLYYSNLENNWNEDGDSIFGEQPFEVL